MKLPITPTNSLQIALTWQYLNCVIVLRIGGCFSWMLFNLKVSIFSSVVQVTNDSHTVFNSLFPGSLVKASVSKVRFLYFYIYYVSFVMRNTLPRCCKFPRCELMANIENEQQSYNLAIIGKRTCLWNSPFILQSI